MTRTAAPLDVLVVGWFPSADDTRAGRFIADQVAALAATGAVSPSVVAFDPVAIRGPGPLRDREAAAVAGHTAASIAAGAPFTRRGGGRSSGHPGGTARGRRR